MSPNRIRILALSFLVSTFASIGVLSSCDKTNANLIEQDWPKIQFTTNTVDFGAGILNLASEQTIWVQNTGDLPLGITGISLGTGDRSEFFSVDYSQSEVSCPESAEADEEEEAKGKRFITDSAAPPDDTDDIDDPRDNRPGSGPALLLEAGCRAPLHLGFTAQAMGVVWGSLIVETGTEEAAKNEEPTYYGDPTIASQIIYLKGEGLRTGSNVVVTPRNYDFGHLWTGETSSSYVVIRNTGASDLEITNVSLSIACDPGFELIDPEGIQMLLGPDEATFAEVAYTALDQTGGTCSLVVDSVDLDTPQISVRLQANKGDDARNSAPTVAIRQPANGLQWISRDPLELEINVFDVDQPATSLDCRVRSMVLQSDTIADCTPTDPSGHVFLELDPATVGTGVDTIRVQVTDDSDVTAWQTISVLFNTSYPTGDDDGDGWDEVPNAEKLFDCDDTHNTAYPYAMEIADGIDNDCNGVIDEGTEFYDDDGDKFTEADGDCDDEDENVYPGAEEIPDEKDSDCDGTIDEGTTLYDDDGDGYTEVDNDCNDNDPTVNPEALEYCDGIDNDCNLLRDQQDGCIETAAPPYIVGTINLQQTACEEGDKIMASVKAYDPDGQVPAYSWSSDTAGLVIDPLTGSSTVSVTCPPIPEQSERERYNIYVVVNDTDRNQDFDQVELYVYSKGSLYKPYQTTEIATDKKSCSSAAGLPGLMLAGLAFSLGLLRRRRA